MIRKNDLSKIKEDIGFCIGQRVMLITNKGKKKVLTREGVLESICPHFFTVKFEDKQATIRDSFGYDEVLRNAVEVIRCSDNLDIQNFPN